MRPVVLYLVVLVGAQLLEFRRNRKKKHHELTNACPLPEVNENDLVIKGETLKFEVEELHRILCKRFHYYNDLNDSCKKIFLNRLHEFISKKIFIIKEEKGFREMPVLVSAAAIQLSFGLKDYLFPFYRYIRIYHTEYFLLSDFAFFAGNVQGNIITVAWNHILKGYEDNSDGVNVGLHEMSHALYIQKMVIEENYAMKFSRKYKELIAKCTVAHKEEKAGITDIYSEYAEKNLQEFWAESVEHFFEKPATLKNHYPDVFFAMKLLLNQNPLHPNNPVLKSRISFEEKFRRIATTIATKLPFDI